MDHAMLLTHMSALGVDWGASAEVVRAEWRKAVRQSHPDIAGTQSTDQMSRINAAYDALKHGVPTRSAGASARASAASDSFWKRAQTYAYEGYDDHRPEHPEASSLRPRRMTIDQELQDRYVEMADEVMTRSGKYTPRRSPFTRFGFSTPRFHYHVPAWITIQPYSVEITYNSVSLRRGTNHFIVPILQKDGRNLVGCGKVDVMSGENAVGMTYLQRSRADTFDDVVLPGITDLPVYISTRRM